LEKNKRIVDLKLIELVKAMPCVISQQRPVDCHHLQSRKSGGPDLPWNLMPLKREYHNEVHQGGKIAMARKYPQFKIWLELKGWHLCPTRKKWVYENQQEKSE
jgi:hypothetical protein